MKGLLLATLGAVLLSSVSGTRSLRQIANAPAADLISAGLNAIQSDPNGTATALANSTPIRSSPSAASVCFSSNAAFGTNGNCMVIPMRPPPGRL